MKQLFSMAKTLGKHIWDSHKEKIIQKGINFGRKKLGNSKFKPIIDHVDDVLK